MLALAARQPFDLATMLIPVLPWWELLIRGIIVYGFLLCLIRLTGRRQTGMLTPFDFILLLILSNTVQNAMNLCNVPTFYQFVARGSILLLAVLFDQWRRKAAHVQ